MIRRVTDHIRKQGFQIVDKEPDDTTRARSMKSVLVSSGSGGATVSGTKGLSNGTEPSSISGTAKGTYTLGGLSNMVRRGCAMTFGEAQGARARRPGSSPERQCCQRHEDCAVHPPKRRTRHPIRNKDGPTREGGGGPDGEGHPSIHGVAFSVRSSFHKGRRPILLLILEAPSALVGELVASDEARFGARDCLP